MQFIHLFLASSILEFDYERQAIGNFVRSLNDIYSPKGIYFKLHMCEDMSEAVTEERKQNEYNEKVRQSDYFFLLLHRKAGKFTVEEFEEALSTFLSNKKEHRGEKPLIIAFVKPLPDGEHSEEVLDFLDRYCSKLQQYPSTFDSIDTVKLKILLHLERAMGASMELSLRDSELMIGSQPLECLQLDRVPMYSKSEAISDLREEAKELEAELAALRQESGGEENASYKRKVRRLEKTRTELRTLESQLMDAARAISSYLFSGRGSTERARKAAELLDEGKTDEALTVLDDEKRKSELQSARENADRALAVAADALSEIQKLVEEALIKIEALRMYPCTLDRAEEMIRLYREAEASIVKYNFDRAPLIEFAVLLREQNRYDEALELAESIYVYYREHTDAAPKKRAEICDILARLYYVSHGENFSKAEGLYLEAIHLSEQAKDMPELSFVYNNLGYYYKAVCQLDKAQDAFVRAYEIRRALAEGNTLYRTKYALSMNSLADIYAELGEYEKAIELYLDALEIRRDEAKLAPSKISYVSRTCYCLSSAYFEIGELGAARKYAAESLDIYRELAVSNSDVYSGPAAQSCISLANIYIVEKNAKEAQALFDEAERHLVSCKDAFMPERKADLYNARGRLAECMGESAKAFYEKALKLRRERAKNNAIAISVEVACDCLALAKALVSENEAEQARSVLQEAIDILQKYHSRNPNVYDKFLSECEELQKTI